MDVGGLGSDNHREHHEGDDQAAHGHAAEEWAEILARTVAHLAAQLTMTQIRLRAMATTFEERGELDAADIQRRMATIATAETGAYLRENLGDALVEMIDVEALETQIAAFLSGNG